VETGFNTRNLPDACREFFSALASLRQTDLTKTAKAYVALLAGEHVAVNPTPPVVLFCDLEKQAIAVWVEPG
jgi:hypothetical protein